MFNANPVRRSFLKPAFVTSIEYCPIFWAVKTYVPSGEVLVVWANEVPSLRIVTVAPGITAPVLSRTVPRIVPVSTCPYTKANARHPKKMRDSRRTQDIAQIPFYGPRSATQLSYLNI